MDILNHKERRSAKLRVFTIYGITLIVIFLGFFFYAGVGNSDYNSLRKGNTQKEELFAKMKDIRANIDAIEGFDSELQTAVNQNQIPAIGRIQLSIDSCMSLINRSISSMEADNQDELTNEIYQNYKTYQSNRAIIDFLNGQMENKGGSGSDPEVELIIKDITILIDQADEAVNGAGKRAGKNELNEVKRLVAQMKAKANML